ncbi:DUF4331 domain-containing protein [Croceicoccus ponticola]|uniref:DUF4331 domain-containing protein n=1 Tax=Croceicoccus ponticola TaxID=2217664 RepID=A0A437GUY7_9SPHN|nr:DUF4331 family protein [Croceicoccus ponticola]RVQ65132.1 DUF4331 domain-containing protein [Croceicoccus ponticola]
MTVRRKGPGKEITIPRPVIQAFSSIETWEHAVQHWKKLTIAGGGGLALAAGTAMLVPGLAGFAADHLDPPVRTDPSVDSTPDRAADIADLYAWHTDSSVILALTFAGPQATDRPATYDRDVLYTINLSNAAPRTTPDIPIRVRFAPGNVEGSYGVQIEGLPGVSGALTGAVETDILKDGVKAHAGLFDDPFFFDLQGFKDTAATGTLSFKSTRDFFAGQNLTGVVIEIPRNRIANGDNPVDVWATTARFGGQL